MTLLNRASFAFAQLLLLGVLAVVANTLTAQSANAQQQGQAGDEIPNTAVVDFMFGRSDRSALSNTVVDVIENTRNPNERTDSTLDFLFHTPGSSQGDGLNGVNVEPTGCGVGGGQTTSVSAARGGQLSFPDSYQLTDIEPENNGPQQVDFYHSIDPVFIRVTDLDEDRDLSAPDSITVTVTSDIGDSETLVLTETGDSTGIFIGALPTVVVGDPPTIVAENCELSVDTNVGIQVNYEDPNDAQDARSDRGLVDPLGVVFDSSTGEPVNGARVTIERQDGPTEVRGDNGKPGYPTTVTSGEDFNFGGVDYDVPEGGFRFPFLEPGDYTLTIDEVPPGYRLNPSEVPPEGLENFEYTIDENGSYGLTFTVPPGPAVVIDIPIDPLETPLFITKTVSEDTAAVGDLVRYELTVTNQGDEDTATAVTIRDVLPVGFRIRAGSVLLNRQQFIDPTVGSSPENVSWLVGDIPPEGTVTLSYVVSITAATSLGMRVNTAQAETRLGVGANARVGQRSNIAEARVLIREDLFRSTNVIIGRVIVGSCDSEVVNDHIGLPGIRLMMEDGRYAVTGRDGRYHFEGITRRPHVVQVDVDSIPDEYEIINCENDSRQAGTAYSRFVDLSGGSLWRVDFHVREKVASESRFQLRLSSEPTKAKAVLESVNYVLRPQFDTLKAELKQLDKIEIANKLRSIKDPRGVRIQVVGHTDSRRINGKRAQAIFADNYALSRARAQSVVDFVKDRLQLEEWQLVAEGRGADEPLVENKGEESWAKNRRVEIRIWGDDVVLPNEALNSITFRLDLKSHSQRYIDQERPVVGHGVTTSVVLPDGVKFVPGSVRLNGEQYRDPIVRGKGRVLTFERGDWIGEREEQFTFRSVVKSKSDQRLIAKATARFYTTRQGELNIIPAVENEFIAPQSDSQRRARVSIPADLVTIPAAPDAADSLLRPVVEAAAGQDGVRLQIVGHAYDASGSQSLAALDAESLRMARAVASRLSETLSVPVEKMSIVGLGGKQPFIGAGSGDAASFNRRVDVSIWVDPRLADSGIRVLENNNQRELETIEKYVTEVPETVWQRPELPLPPREPSYSRNWFASVDSSLEFVWPPEDYNPRTPHSGIAVKHDSRYRLLLEVNGKEANRYRYQGIERGGDKAGIAVSRWEGHELDTGPNEIQATLFDKSGNEVETKTYNIHAGGLPIRFEWVPEFSYNVANPNYPTIMAFRLFDQWGKPTMPYTFGSFSVSAPYVTYREQKLIAENPTAALSADGAKYQVSDNGLAFIELAPTSDSGPADFIFSTYLGKPELVRAFVKPKPRDWIIVGIAEGSVAYNTLKDNSEALGEEAGEDRYITDGRVAFYAQGRVRGEWLLTVAYDSSKPSLDDRRRLEETINPGEYYTLYGDNSTQGYDAASSDKLYVKLEREEFQLLYGDYLTGLNETTLSNYNRTLTGVQGVYFGENFRANVFAADTPQSFARDEIPGDGTSGLYQLSGSDILINSEKIKIQTRDRFRSDNIINERVLARNTDYSIDYSDGTIYFRQPIFARDDDFNPIFIIAEYETLTGDDESFTVGGRMSLGVNNNKVVFGLSAVMEDAGENRETVLAGIDVTARVSKKTEIKAEYAVSDNNLTEPLDATYVTLNHSGPVVRGSIYYRDQDAGFGLGHQNAVEGGTRRYGGEAKIRLPWKSRMNVQAGRQENKLTDLARDFFDAEIAKQIGKVSASVGFEYARDEVEGGGNLESTLGTLGLRTTALGGRLGLGIGYEAGIGDTDVSDYPEKLTIGADYLIGSGTRVFLRQEFTDTDGTATRNTRVGVTTSPWSGATASADINQEISEFGPRLFSNIGVQQRVKLTERLSGDIGIESVRTLRRDQDSGPANNTAASGSTNSGDFTAVNVGLAYNREDWSVSSRLEYRDSEASDRWNLFTGFYSEKQDELGLSMSSRLGLTDFEDGSEQREAQVTFGFVLRRRPSRWTILDKLELRYDDLTGDTVDTSSRKLVNNFVVNYRHNRNTQISMNYGAKYVRQTIDNQHFSSFTDLVGAEIRRDFGFTKGYRPWDIGIHGDVLTSHDDDVRDFAFGVELGRTIARNLRLAVGYNLSGYKDDDLDFDRYRERGPFANVQFRFDQDTLRGLLGKRDTDNPAPVVNGDRPTLNSGYQPTLEDF